MGVIQGSINQLLGTAAGAATLVNYQLGKTRAAAEAKTNEKLEDAAKLSPAVEKHERERITESRLGNTDSIIGNVKQLGDERTASARLDRANMQIARSKANMRESLRKIRQERKFKEFAELIKNPNSTQEDFNEHMAKWGDR